MNNPDDSTAPDAAKEPAPAGSMQRMVGRRSVAEKWGCTLEEADDKIATAAHILRLGHDEAIAFLMAIHPAAMRKPPNHA